MSRRCPGYPVKSLMKYLFKYLLLLFFISPIIVAAQTDSLNLQKDIKASLPPVSEGSNLTQGDSLAEFTTENDFSTSQSEESGDSHSKAKIALVLSGAEQ